MNAIAKTGHVLLAIMLIMLTCFVPVGLFAFAEDESQTSEQTEVNGVEPEAEALSAAQTDEAAGPDAAAASDEAAANEDTAPQSSDPEAEALPASDELLASSAPDEAATAEGNSVLAAQDTIAEAEANEANAAEAAGAANAAEANAAEAEANDSHTFDISSTLELMDAYKYDINTQSNESFVINLNADIVLNKPADRFDTHGKRLNVGTDRLSVKHGNTVTILGHGHTITYNDKSMNNLSLNAQGGTLILGSEDGSDTLTINFTGTGEVEPLVSAVQGGTCVINEGVTLSNNVNQTGLAGGGVLIQSGGTLIMNGGVIENCTNSAIPYGGGVAVDGGTFYMNGGIIKGNSEPDEAQSYQGAGGGVAVGLHGTTSTFVMSGNATIVGNTAKYGGGVYVGTNGTFTMQDNASILNNTATLYGGGVYVEQGGSFTMGQDNVIKGNNAQHGGGVLNFGTAVVTNVYDNNASVAGADIYNGGTITMQDVKADWALSKEQSTSDPSYVPATDTSTPVDDSKPDLAPITLMSLAAVEPEADDATSADNATGTLNPSSKVIDGWYYDGHRETGETDADGNPVVEHNRWNANESTDDLPQYLKNYVVTGEPTNEVMGLKAAHAPTASSEIPHTINVIWENYDGTELFTLAKVDAEHVPAADEYEELSGNENPTEPDDATNDYEFEGWDKSVEPDGDVIYTAEYEAIPHDAPDPTPEPTPDPSTTPVDPRANDDAPTPDPAPTEPEKPVEEHTGALAQMGDPNALFAVGLSLAAALAAGGLVFAGTKLSRVRKEER